MGFNSISDFIKAITVNNKGQKKRFHKNSITSVANYWYRLWTTPGYPGAGSEPSGSLNGVIPTKDTAGAISFVNPTTPATLHLSQDWFNCINQNSIMLHDRIWHCANINLNSAGLQSITFNGPLSRYANGIDVIMALELTTAGGTTQAIATISYTNTDDVAGRSATVTILASSPVNRVYFFDLQSGDKGVKSIQSIQLSAATGGGVANLVFLYSLDLNFIESGQTNIKDLISQFPSAPRIYDDACISAHVLASTTTTGLIIGELLLAEN